MKQKLIPLTVLPLAGAIAANDVQAQNTTDTISHNTHHVADTAGVDTAKTIKYPVETSLNIGVATSSYANPAIYRRPISIEFGTRFDKVLNKNMWHVSAEGKISVPVLARRKSRSGVAGENTNVRDFITDNRIEAGSGTVSLGVGLTLALSEKTTAQVDFLQLAWKMRGVTPYDTVTGKKQQGGKLSFDHNLSFGQSIRLHFKKSVLQPFIEWGISPDSHLMQRLSAPGPGYYVEKEKFDVWHGKAGLLFDLTK
jgi:hypothetical protein